VPSKEGTQSTNHKAQGTLVGITYDLREDYIKAGYSAEETAEFDHISTINAIDEALKNLSYGTTCIGNIKSLTAKLAAGERWDMVFNICEGMHGLGREAQVPALLDAYNIPYTFSDALVLALTLHKSFTKNIIRDNGLATPDFFLVRSISDVEKINLPYPLFAKPVAEGTGKGITASSKIKDSSQLREICAQLLNKFKQPVLVETFLPGREFTVGITGTGEKAEVLGVMEIILNKNAEKEVYSFDNKENYQGRVEYELAGGKIAEECGKLALAAWDILGCRDAGRIDVKLDCAGIPNFLEVNPLAGLRPIHSDLAIICDLQKIPYIDLIRKIMDSAMVRMEKVG